jgi:hypothetical protein
MRIKADLEIAEAERLLRDSKLTAREPAREYGTSASVEYD